MNKSRVLKMTLKFNKTKALLKYYKELVYFSDGLGPLFLPKPTSAVTNLRALVGGAWPLT
jgi:hypothetical protein